MYGLLLYGDTNVEEDKYCRGIIVRHRNRVENNSKNERKPYPFKKRLELILIDLDSYSA